MNELILYKTADGATEIELRAEGGTVWLTQAEIAELFAVTPQNITLHIKSIYEQGELQESATCKESLQVRKEGSRNVERLLKQYNLEVILAVGYRISSPRGVQFRQWATTTLQEYLVKGFVINDEKLKNIDEFDYFDELLERIREIRASEKRFYQKIRDIYATSNDYDPNSDAAQTFFATVQNKMLFATTGKTAAELIVNRADASQPNMGLTSWKGSRVRKGDVVTAKNYLQSNEITDLNRIVTMFLDYAEDQARQRKIMTMQDWAAKLDGFLSFNERTVLKNAGSVSADDAKQIAFNAYDKFDAARHVLELEQAEREHLAELEKIKSQIEKSIDHKPKKS